MGLLRISFQLVPQYYTLSIFLKTKVSCSPSSLRTQKSVVRALATEASSSSSTKMVKAIRVHEHGGPEVLKWEDVEIGEPKEGEIRIKNKANGLNFISLMFTSAKFDL